MVTDFKTRPPTMTMTATTLATMRPGPGLTAPRLRAGLVGCAVMLCVAGSAALPNSAAAQPADCRQTPSLDQRPAKPPEDVCGPDEIGADDFYALSWQMFKFLVWPAASAERGTSDTTKPITDMRGPRVFETFKADWEIFQPNDARPAAWQEHPSKPCENQPDVSPDALVLASFSKFGNLKEGGPLLSHVLVAQNGSYVRYQAAYNRIIFDNIMNHELYDAAVVSRIPDADPHGPVPTEMNNPDGALTVKSAWIELSGESANAETSRFYVRDDAWVQDPETRECRKASVGLVGLHVVYKTKSRPQWIWSTFEHVDNVPEPGDVAGRSYTFHNGDLGTTMANAPPDNTVIQRGSAGPRVPPAPYQVERRQKIADKVLRVNKTWQDELGRIGSVWRHYKLVMSQWPFPASIPDEDAASDFVTPMPPCGPTTPATGNTTMETFQQRCEAHLTCMGCHNVTRRTDFIWAIHLNASAPPGFSGPQPRAAAIKTLQDILQNKR